jgi:hypothetical protein
MQLNWQDQWLALFISLLLILALQNNSSNMLAGECSIVTLITVYTLGLNSAQMMLKRDSWG